MTTYNTNLLPAQPGLDLGSLVQPWDGFFQNLYLAGVIIYAGSQLNTVTWSAAPDFDFSLGQSQLIVLSGDVASSTVSNPVAGIPYTFIIRQDSTGGWTFVWPTNFLGATIPDTGIGVTTVQQFIYDGTDFYPVSAATIT